MTLKAFQKNAVQSYFERQQQQQQQQNSPTKDPTMPSLRTNPMANGENVNNLNNKNSQQQIHVNGSNTSLNNISIRPQSLPMNKMHSSMESIPQTRLSLPNKLSQIINLTTQLAAQKQMANQTPTIINRQNDSLIKNAIINSPVKSSVKTIQHEMITMNTSRVMTIDQQNNLQSINETGVPPPPPRRSNRTVVPVRR